LNSTQLFYPWGNQRRYNNYTEYFKKTFGERIQKITIDAGFTCPNRDGTRGTGGCSYCNNDAFNPSYCIPEKSITQQILEGIEFHANRYRRATKFLAYFQAYSNTYAPINRLRELFDEALSVPGIIGLVIGTRPDCIDSNKLDYFQEIAKNHYLIIEYGIESCINRTLKRINRGHTFEESITAIKETADRGIKVGAHLIFGLPGETHQDMLDEVKFINQLPISNIKFHQLQIIKDTQMANEYQQHPEDFSLFGMEEYMAFIISFIERLNPAIVIERFTAEVPPRFLAGPGWGLLRTDTLLQIFEKKLEELDTWQGRLYQTETQ
jgi:radical SAM protein (TIGR01212 family)